MKRAPVVVALALAACSGSTGGALVSFHAAAAGPIDAVAGQPLVFTTSPPNGATYQVTLTRARLHVGAVYLNRSVPISGAQAQGCVLPGIYSGQVTEPLDVDVLSPDPQPFATEGEGTADLSQSAEVWLFGTDPFATDDATIIADVAGTAVGGGATISFAGRFSVGQNFAVPVSNPALPGANPICKKRIVTHLGVEFRLATGGTLLVRVDPRVWFAQVDFAQIPVDPTNPDPTQRRFANDRSDAADVAFVDGGLLASNAYAVNWQSP